MDIKGFKAWAESKKLSTDGETGRNYSYTFYDSKTQAAWYAWQAQAVPEGFVLVPVQCPDPDFADSLFDELSKKAIGEFGDDLLIHFSDIDEEKIWALMVEAAKAQAVPEKDAIIQKLSDQLYAQEMKTSAARVLCETACELLDGYAHQDAMVIINDLEQAMKEPTND